MTTDNTNGNAVAPVCSKALLESLDCCNQHCRDWRETLSGRLPPSRHAPSCQNYKTETFFRVTLSGSRSPAVILGTQEEVDETIGDCPEEYEVGKIDMTRDQFENLGEFDGW